MQITDPIIPTCIIDSIKNLVYVNSTLWCIESTFTDLVTSDTNLLINQHNNYLNKLGEIQCCLWQNVEVEDQTSYTFTLFLTSDINYPFAYILLSKNRFYNNYDIKLVFATVDQFNINCNRMKQLWLGDRKL